MTSRRLALAMGLLIATGFVCIGGSGCARHDPVDSNIPWGRPAAWEERIPGMGDF